MKYGKIIIVNKWNQFIIAGVTYFMLPGSDQVWRRIGQAQKYDQKYDGQSDRKERNNWILDVCANYNCNHVASAANEQSHWS